METLRVSADLSRRDLVAVNLRLLPHLRNNRIVMGAVAAGIFGYALYRTEEVSALFVIVAAFAAAVGAVTGLLAGFLINLLFMFLSLGKNSGVLGRHDYSITPAGFRERTTVNDNHHLWGGVESVKQLGEHLVVNVNGYLIYIVPRRSFESDAGFDTFAAQAEAWRDAAHAQRRLQQG